MSSRIVDVVFERSSHSPIGWVVAGCAGALLVHAGLLAFASTAHESLEEWGESVAEKVHDGLDVSSRIEIESAPPPAPPPPTPAAPVAPEPPPSTVAPAPAPAPVVPRAQSPARAPASASTPPAPSPASAGRLAAASEVLDLSDGAFVSGGASAYAGGTTTPSGTSATAVEGPRVAERAERAERAEISETVASSRASLATPVGLEDDDWRCPWPSSATDRDEAVAVIVRVVVRSDGTPESARVVRDADGFGASAIACALEHRYTPARNAAGAAIRAESPPIRVRFDP